MRKIDVRPYPITLALPNGQEITDDFKVKESLAICLCHPQLQISGLELLNRRKILDKIEAADGTLLLEDDEWEKMKQALETITGMSKNEIPMIERVLEAEEIEVTEKQNGTK